MDSQWPRYEVFEQEQPGGPHRNVGSVHAPDAEIALENARDVFARRPRCSSLWVVRESAILSRTAEELTEAAQPLADSTPGGAPEPYLVFQKQTQRAGETFVVHVGEVEARSPEEALRRALDTFSNRDVFVWWVCPARAVTRSTEADAESLFVQASSKPYRLPQFYHVVARLYEIKRGSNEPKEEEARP